VLAVLGGLSSLVAAAPEVHAAPRSSSGRSYAVATENETASRAALRALEHGGNAVDAAVTAALVAGVASPSSSGMGGGGFALLFDAATRQVTCLDFREVAPRGVDVAAFERRPFAPAERGRAVGVPGEVKGLFELHQQHGRKPWADAVRPAMRAAADGYPVSPHLASALATTYTKLAVDDPLLGLFGANGHPRTRGARIRNPRLAATLGRVAAEGPSALYEGTVPADLVAAAASAGGALTVQDFASYRTHPREPIHVSWEGYDVYTMAPPSGTGLMLGETLGMLSSTELRALGAGTAAYTHLVAEALRGALADRMRFVADPDQQPVDVAKLLAPERLAARKRSFTPDHTHPLPAFSAEEHGTHHMVFADRDGNVVSLTTTVNHAFGSMISGPASGIVLNDELDDFTASSGVRQFGLKESPNRARPGARSVSSMVPTIVLRGGVPVLALGGSGGMAIGPNVTQALLSRLVFGLTPEQSVSALRFGVPTEGSTISVDMKEEPRLRAALEAAGEVVSVQKPATHAVQMIAFDHGRKLPASDPRKFGSALAE
jgi:gamma-glutamyltranspeptidase / glutathione hydrolase